MDMVFDLDNTMDLLNFRNGDDDLLKGDSINEEDLHQFEEDGGWMNMGMDGHGDLNFLGLDVQQNNSSQVSTQHNQQHQHINHSQQQQQQHHHHSIPPNGFPPAPAFLGQINQSSLDFDSICGTVVQPPLVPNDTHAPAPKRRYRKRKSEPIDAGVATSSKKKMTTSTSTSASAKDLIRKPVGGMKKFSSAPVVPMAAMDFQTNGKFQVNKTITTTSMNEDNKNTSAPPTPRLKQTSSFRGVSCCGKDRKWQARIRDANKVRYLGRFQTEVEAALVYDDAARSLKGDKAPTNFIQMDEETIDVLKRAFVENGNIVPDRLGHLIARGRGKNSSPSNKKSQRINLSKVHQQFDFPDSPLAKIHSTKAPAISPANKFKPSPNTQVQSRLQLDRNIQKTFVQSSANLLNQSIRV